eukprot:CAMPEP_0182473644 /NCGR_PEP_ID=MMETSP1319-20130603/24290_1 /TAXON_ID=172717 /ORGANISM="Bolidomonas pacifica, Strain RCC208" /LENGTH=310 /DNA_ID=CAMNT_0024674467 /DNA_START=115 /DNA_END=1045 /DNA_ORIENTATION=+
MASFSLEPYPFDDEIDLSSAPSSPQGVKRTYYEAMSTSITPLLRSPITVLSRLSSAILRSPSSPRPPPNLLDEAKPASKRRRLEMPREDKDEGKDNKNKNKTAAASQPVVLLSVPEDCILHLLSFINLPIHLSAVGACCKSLRSLSLNPVLLSETPLTETRIMDRMPFTPPPLSRLVPYLNAGNPTAKFFKGMSQCYVTSEPSRGIMTLLSNTSHPQSLYSAALYMRDSRPAQSTLLLRSLTTYPPALAELSAGRPLTTSDLEGNNIPPTLSLYNAPSSAGQRGTPRATAGLSAAPGGATGGGGGHNSSR